MLFLFYYVGKVSELVLTRVLQCAFASRQYGAIDYRKVDIIQRLNTKTIHNATQNGTKDTLQLQLGLGLGLLQHRVKLGGLHDVALDLELAAHEETLGIGLASDELAEVLFGEDEGN